MITTQVEPYTKPLLGWFNNLENDLVVGTVVGRTNIRVDYQEDTWLIVVRSKRCRLDGHVITPNEPECDPRWEYQESDCGD